MMLIGLTICTHHNIIIDDLKNLSKKMKKLGLSDIITEINDTIEIVQDAKLLGKRMEKGLKLYRNAVEKLGFERKR